jgi:hypothetical protein
MGWLIPFLFHWFMFLGLPFVLIGIFGRGLHTVVIYVVLLGAYLGQGLIRSALHPKPRRRPPFQGEGT